MGVCTECGKVSLWLDEYAGWCRGCLKSCSEWYDNLPDGYKWSDEDLEEMEEW